MTRKQFLQNTSLAGIFSLYPGIHRFFVSCFPTGFEMRLLRNNIGIFTERGGTIGWMIRDEGIVVIDSQFPEQASHLLAEIRKRSDLHIAYLINTHHHRDHTSGNPVFRDAAKHILAHENAVKNQRQSALARGNEQAQVYADMTFSSQWSENAGGEIITLRYFGAAHTDGDAIIHFENANIVHMGDLIFNRRHPYIDTNAGASIQNWITVLQAALETFSDDTIFIFGHAGEGHDVTGNKKDLLAFSNYLEKLLVYTAKQIKAGNPLESVIEKTQTIPGAEEWQGRGTERCLRAAYLELTKN